MSKKELINAVASEADITKAQAERAVNAFVKVVTDELSDGGRVQLTGFGTFEVGERKSRNGINPKTKEKIVVPAKNMVRFKAGSVLKEAIK